jgi:hypothetical protein
MQPGHVVTDSDVTALQKVLSFVSAATEPPRVRQTSTIVSTPGKHVCDLPLGCDPVGTVRCCDCGQHWVVASSVGLGDAQGVHWRREKPRERRRRERAQTMASGQFPSLPEGFDPPSAALRVAPPVARGGYSSGGRTASELPTPPASVTRPKAGGYSGLRPASEVPPPPRSPSSAVTPGWTPATNRAHPGRLAATSRRDRSEPAVSSMTGHGRSADRLAELLAANGDTLRLAMTEALYRVQVEYTWQLLEVVDEVCDEVTANLITDAIYGRLSGTGAAEADQRVREAREAAVLGEHPLAPYFPGWPRL